MCVAEANGRFYHIGYNVGLTADSWFDWERESHIYTHSLFEMTQGALNVAFLRSIAPSLSRVAAI